MSLARKSPAQAVWSVVPTCWPRSRRRCLQRKPSGASLRRAGVISEGWRGIESEGASAVSSAGRLERQKPLTCPRAGKRSTAASVGAGADALPPRAIV